VSGSVLTALDFTSDSKMRLFMNSIIPMANQATIKDRSRLCLLQELQLPDFGSKNDLMRKAKAVRYVKNEPITSETNKNSLTLIFYGKVSVRSVGTDNSKEITFQIQELNEGFGGLAVLTDEVKAVSKITLENTLFSTIPKADFNHWLMNHLDVKFAFLPLPIDKLDS
jgi:hypothetical protein